MAGDLSLIPQWEILPCLTNKIQFWIYHTTPIYFICIFKKFKGSDIKTEFKIKFIVIIEINGRHFVKIISRN